MKKIFILGSERSGSTWLANIFDAHPDVEFFMEPFADYTRIFPLVPLRNIYLDCPPGQTRTQQLTRAVNDGYKQLHSFKYPLFYKSGKSLAWKKTDWALTRFYAFLKKKLRSTLPLGYWRWHLMNLNALDIPINRHTRKNPVREFIVSKELRLNFKIPLISQTFPGAFYVVCIRHPGAQISSILKLFKRGSLGELNRSLSTFIKDIQSQPQLEPYHPLPRDKNWETDTPALLALWWCINYNVLLSDLRRLQCQFRVINHETLSQHPFQTVKELFDFTGLDLPPQVKNYIDTSTQHASSSQTNTGTDRSSAHYYQQMIEEVDPEVNEAIGEILTTLKAQLDPHIQNYKEQYYTPTSN